MAAGMVQLARRKAAKKGQKHYFAVKCLPKYDICKRKMMDSVVAEIQAIQTISSPFVIHLFGTFQDSHSIYLVLEYCIGGELFTRFNNSLTGKMDESEAKFYGIEIALGLSAIHDAGYAYRDLKPDNVMIDPFGCVNFPPSSLSVHLTRFLI